MKLLVIAMCALLAACTPPATLPATVKVPVPTPCPPPPPTVRPRLPVSTLPAQPSPDEYVRAVESSLEALVGYATELETLDRKSVV